ncbi:hypothetical protein DB30_00739 [Enhygromyxa salina]|uniref:ATPase AAA-type core domain-containing protein n=1 Tax=Enhygromyxa salina TaxID=215803 RepID=A0A0C1ZLQ0_9BACT|nr:ATP-binding protein [Enhygromyxa salina]KIG18454.1 hypothetical protein DB30_00739 [Enhygromyxa salina]
MITRLEVDGFKSLLGFAVDLEPFTVFIGPNGAGKSNILEALGLLSRLASEPIVDAFRHGRGRPSDQFTHLGGEVAQEIRFGVEFLFWGPCPSGAGTTASRLRYELVIERSQQDSGTERLIARHEELRYIGRDEDTWIGSHPEFANVADSFRGGDRQFVATRDSTVLDPDVSPQPVRVDPHRTFLAQSRESIPFNLATGNLRGCQWIRLDLANLAGPSDRVDTGALRPDGSNLPTVLADLAPRLLGEVRADLVALVPGISSFFVVPEGESFRVEFELSGGERSPARLTSDGTLRLLALLTSLHLRPRPQLIGIEEPENGIYPGRLRALVDLLLHETQRRIHEEAEHTEQIADTKADPLVCDFVPTQILLTTHSLVILAALREHPTHLRYVDTVHREGRRASRARRVGRASKENRHLVISAREIEQLLDVAKSEAIG